MKVAREGDALLGSTITAVNISSTFPNVDGLSGLNKWGQVAFDFTLADGRRGVAISSATTTPGDFNSDGKVIASDYALWRKTGINGQAGYDTWRTNFGQGAGSGSAAIGSASAVPEPAFWSLLTVASALGISRRFRSSKYVGNGFAQKNFVGGVSDPELTPRSTTYREPQRSRRQRRLPQSLFWARPVGNATLHNWNDHADLNLLRSRCLLFWPCLRATRRPRNVIRRSP
jgi:hypothetical protein